MKQEIDDLINEACDAAYDPDIPATAKPRLLASILREAFERGRYDVAPTVPLTGLISNLQAEVGNAYFAESERNPRVHYWMQRAYDLGVADGSEVYERVGYNCPRPIVRALDAGAFETLTIEQAVQEVDRLHGVIRAANDERSDHNNANEALRSQVTRLSYELTCAKSAIDANNKSYCEIVQQRDGLQEALDRVELSSVALEAHVSKFICDALNLDKKQQATSFILRAIADLRADRDRWAERNKKLETEREQMRAIIAPETVIRPQATRHG